jgi:hypothetical protein
VRTFVAVALMLASCGSALTVAVDPSGLLHMQFPGLPRLCAPGIAIPDRDSKALLPRFTAPREILLGTSRVAVGFADWDADRLLRPPVLNLGVRAATLADVRHLLNEAIAAGALERAWLGLDFGMFQSELQPPALTSAASEPRTLTALRHGLADPRVVRRALAQLVDRRDCRLPPHSVRGFRNLPKSVGREAVTPPSDRLVAEAADREWRLTQIAAADPVARGRVYRTRLRMLEEMIAYARRHRVELVLFLNPSDRGFHRLVDRAGLRASHERWRTDTAALARRHGLILVDLAEMPNLPRTPACGGASCDFFDLTHYRPHVGRYILHRGVAALAARDGRGRYILHGGPRGIEPRP